MKVEKEKKPTKNSKQNISDQDQGSFVLDATKKILSTTWGMRAALGLSGVILFFMGYVIGNWGTSDLQARVAQKKEEINDLLAEKKNLTAKKLELKQRVTTLEIKLSDSKSKMRFLKQRNKIRKPLYDALEYWKKDKKTETKVKLHAAIINLSSEAKGSMGLSRWFYEATTRRLAQAIKEIDSDCAGSAPQGSETKDKPASGCKNKILHIITRATEILPAPKE